MSKIKLTGSNSGYVEISSAADAGNLTLALPTSGTVLLSNADNVFTGITTFTGLNITDDVTLNGGSYDVVWDASDNQLEFGTNAKLSFGASSDLQIHRSGTHSYIKNSSNTLVFNSDAISLTNYAGNSNRIVTAASGEVKLYYSDSVKLETTNTGAIVTGICTATSFSGSGENLTRTTQLSHRNIIINGAMSIAQRATSSTAGGGYNTVDRIDYRVSGADEGPTQSQVDVASGTTPYTLGFRKAFRFTNGNQTGGAGAGDYLFLFYQVEGQDIVQSGWNYKSPSSFITLSFWVKSSVAQNFYGYIRSRENTEQSHSYETGTLSANTWTKVTKTFAGNSNIVMANDNGQGLGIYLAPFFGTDYTDNSKGTSAWSDYTNPTRTPDSTSTWWTTNDATFEITGLQLEVGSVATPFEHRSFAEQLALCQRYYEIVSPTGGLACWSWGSNVGSTNVFWKVRKRTTPSVGYNGTLSNSAGADGTIGVYSSNGGWRAWGTLTPQEALTDSVRISFGGMGSSWTAGYSIGIYFYGEQSNIYGDAEL